MNTNFTIKTIVTLLLSALIFNASAQYDAVFDPSVLNGENGFRMTPTATSHSRLGHSVSFIGDVNNDGFDDVAIADDYDIGDGSVVRPGKVFVIFGTSQTMPVDFDLSTLDGSNGFVIRGVSEENRLGEVVCGLKDINGDGISDFALIESSSAVVIYGRTGDFPALMEKTDIDGTNGFIIEKDNMTSIADAGDHNGDGINDFILGVPHWDDDAWIIFGRSDNYPASIGSSYLDGVGGYKAVNYPSASRGAYVVSGAGDVNNDGFDDVIVGAWTHQYIYYENEFEISYLVYGHSGDFPSSIDLYNSTADVAVQITNRGNSFISRCSPAGDINGDGIDDFVSDGNVFFGSETAYPRFFSKATLDGTNGFHLPKFSFPAPLGDFNNDGIDDLILDGALVLFGKTTAFTDSLELDYFDGINGFQFKSTSWSDKPGSAGRGDFNGDGIDDIVTRTMVLFGGKKLSTITTSVKDEISSLELKLNVYPNPTSEMLNVETSHESGELYITSLEGKLLHQQSFATTRMSLDVSSLKTGLYILSIVNSEKGVQRVRFNKL